MKAAPEPVTAEQTDALLDPVGASYGEWCRACDAYVPPHAIAGRSYCGGCGDLLDG